MNSTEIRRKGRARRQKHIRKKISGTAVRPRLAVFRSAKNIYAQLIDDVEGNTLVATSSLSKTLSEKLTEAKDPTAVGNMVGEELARLAQEKGISSCVFDRSGYAYWGRVKSLAEGARKGGLKF